MGSVIKRILGYVKPYKGLLCGALFGAVASVVAALFAPVLIGRAIDTIVGAGEVDFARLVDILLWLAGTVAVAALTQWMMLVCTRKLSAAAAQNMRRDAFAAIDAAPLKRIDGHSRGDLVSRLVNDADAVAEGLLQALSQLLPGAVSIVATVVLMLSLNIWIALLVIVATPVSVFFARFMAKRSAGMFRAQGAAQGALSGFVGETVRMQNLVRAFSYEEESCREFEQLSEEYAKANYKATLYSSVANPGTRFVNALVYAAVGVFGAVLAIYGGITVGGLSAFLSYANQYTKPFNEVSAVMTQMQTALASGERLLRVMDWESEKPDAPNAAAPTHSEGRVEAKEVYFSYRKDRPLIQDLSFAAAPGMRVALVGPTGCGKTTIINLLMRFYELDSGTIAVDGADSMRIQRSALRALYGMVLQETWLKSGSVRENIAYGKPRATDEEVVAAAKAARAHSFIKRLPAGYDTVIEEGGSGLSEGQRQLLSIARVMLAKPDILILDEATSSIDTRTEMLLQQALEQLMAGRTSFIVAHRLSTIQHADLILVLDAGRVVERGTHEQLLQKGGFYAKLYHSQFDG